MLTGSPAGTTSSTSGRLGNTIGSVEWLKATKTWILLTCLQAGPGCPGNKGLDSAFVEEILKGLRDRKFTVKGKEKGETKMRVDVLSDK